MVVFTCAHCGESLHKPKVDKHYETKCRNRCPDVCCVDCLKDFRGDEFRAHTKCVSEAERYGGKGFQAKPNQNKGEKKQNAWIEIVQTVIAENVNLPKSLKFLLDKISNQPNTPRKQSKFLNFVRSLDKRAHQNDIDKAWELLSAKLALVKSTPPAKNQGEEGNDLNGTSEPKKENTNDTVAEVDKTNGKDDKPREDNQTEEKDVILAKKERKEKKKRQKHEAEAKELEENTNDTMVVDDKMNGKDDAPQEKNNSQPEGNQAEEQDVNLTKKERKEKKKREKYEAELKELQEKTNVENHNDIPNKGEEVNRKSKKRKAHQAELEETNAEKVCEPSADGSKKAKKRNAYREEIKAEVDNRIDQNGDSNEKLTKEMEAKQLVLENGTTNKKGKKRKAEQKEPEVEANVDSNPNEELPKKKNKKPKLDGEPTNGYNDEIPANENHTKAVVEESPSVQNGNKEFHWMGAIMSVLNSKGKDIALKKLQKRVLAEYCVQKQVSEVTDRIIKKFNKTLHGIQNVKIENDKVSLQC